MLPIIAVLLAVLVVLVSILIFGGLLVVSLICGAAVFYGTHSWSIGGCVALFFYMFGFVILDSIKSR